MARIGVIGAGVMGVVGASELSKRGHSVTLLTSQDPRETLSQRVPPAIILPCVADWTDGEDKIERREQLQWERLSFEHFSHQADRDGTGVSTCHAVMLFDADRGERPYWRDYYKGFRRANADELPTGFEYGWSFSTYVNTKVWLGNLIGEFINCGGQLVKHSVSKLLPEEWSFDAWLVCPGIGARQLFPEDSGVYGSRGQLVEVELNDVTIRRRALIHAPEVRFKAFQV